MPQNGTHALASVQLTHGVDSIGGVFAFAFYSIPQPLKPILGRVRVVQNLAIFTFSRGWAQIAMLANLKDLEKITGLL